jgi:uncharacterized protein (UPF0264 family)
VQPLRSSARLAISVFDAEEVRAAISGGADIIDCEDPRAAIGMFEPRVVTEIAYAVRQTSTMATPTSANIGIPQVLKGAAVAQAARRPRLEIQAKAAQEALGLAAAMDVGDGRPNIIKFEVDGLWKDDVAPFVGAVKGAIRHSRQFQNHRVIASCLELDRPAWRSRRSEKKVVRQLLDLGEFFFDDGPDSVDLYHYYTGEDRPRVAEMMKEARSDHSMVALNEPSDPSELDLPTTADDRLRCWVDELASAGADGVMIDTPIQAKVAGISLLDTFSPDQLRRFSEYCAYMRVECWLAGSIQPDDAGLLGAFPDVDVIMCRGAASEEVHSPFGAAAQEGRSAKRISATRVAELAERIVNARK